MPEWIGFDFGVRIIYGEEKYEEFVKTVTKTLNHTKVFLLGEEQKNEKIGRSIIIMYQVKNSWRNS